MSEDRFVLNVNPGGADVLHRNPREECNQDDATGKQNIDADTAGALLSCGEVSRCQHCNSEEDPS